MNLFPAIRDHELLPWWAGIAYTRYQTRDYLAAPIPLNWIIAWTMVAYHFLRRPSIALGVLLKREQVDRLMKTQLENYRLKIELGDARVALRNEVANRVKAEMERDQLQVALNASLSERLTPEARAAHREQEYGYSAALQHLAVNYGVKS